jgi:FixJ family two-component response regulator
MIAPIGYLLDTDLMFNSRITGTAKALGLQLITCRTPADLLTKAHSTSPACVLLDVHHHGLAIDELIAGLKATGPVFVVGYGSHVAANVLKEARAAGCDLVLPRSQFVGELEKSLPIWFGSVKSE